MHEREPSDWQELTRLTGGAAFVVERVRLAGKDIAIEGSFAPPQLARLTGDDQVFVAAFLRSHGSIKEMEQMFGVSYPTIKARLTRIAASLEFIDESPAPGPHRGAGPPWRAARSPPKPPSPRWRKGDEWRHVDVPIRAALGRP